MKFSERITAPRIVALVIANLIPLAAIILGVRTLFGGTLITLSFLIAFIILPCLALIWNFFLITSKKKTWAKTLLCIFLLIVFIFVFLGTYLFGTFEMINSYKDEEVAEYYSKVSDKFELMPKLEETGQPDTIEYYDYFSQTFGIFTCDSDVLICGYNEQDYKEQKLLLDEKYIFQQNPETIAVTEIDGYVFRLLSVGGEYDYQIDYPKRLVLVAINDDTREIVYVSFYNDDLDYITTMADFINDDCGWEHIR